MKNYRILTNFRLYIVILIAISWQRVLFSIPKAEIKAIEDAFLKEDLNACKTLINSAKPETDEEKALVLYYKAMISFELDDSKKYFFQLVETYPKTIYAQKAYLELGQQALLHRDYSQALASFKRVTDASMSDKFYWFAHTYFQMGDFKNAISSGEQYLRLVKTGNNVENIHYLIADSYLSLNQYNNAITILRKVLSNNQMDENRQYLYYRLGYAYEMLFNFKEALNYYKAGIELNRYSSLAYQIEDRLFDLKERYPNSIDLTFLYPFADYPLPEIVQADLASENTEKNGPEEGYTNNHNNADLLAKEAKKTDQLNISNPFHDTGKTPLLKQSEIKQGIYLQAGRFSKESNASALTEKIIKLNFPAFYYMSTLSSDISWVVVSGPYATMMDAQNVKDSLRQNGIDSFIIQR